MVVVTLVVAAERLAFGEADGWELSKRNPMLWAPPLVYFFTRLINCSFFMQKFMLFLSKRGFHITCCDTALIRSALARLFWNIGVGLLLSLEFSIIRCFYSYFRSQVEGQLLHCAWCSLHCRYVAERTPNWFNTLKECLECTPSAAVGEVILSTPTSPPVLFFNILEEIKHKIL